MSPKMASNNSGNSYKYRFLSEPDDALKCLICLEVAEEPWQQYDCGRLFCKVCLDKHGRGKPCPNCRMKQPQYFPDNRGKREIRSLRVKCHNVERTCTWEGTVGTVEKHVTTCQFTLLPCPNQCKDHSNKTNHFMRKDLEHHLKEDCSNREYRCGYCKEEGTFATITQVHDKVCLKKIVPCSNTGCTKTMPRHQISQHVESECECTLITCKHKSIGCKTELKRKDMPAHELDDKLHLHMAINTVTQLKEDSDIVLKQGEPMTIRFGDYQARKQSKKHFFSPPFYTSHGYKLALRVDANGCSGGKDTHVSVFAKLLKGKNDSHLHWPFVGSITIKLLNQLENNNHHNLPLTVPHEIDFRVESLERGATRFIPHSALGHDPIKNTQYLKDDTMHFQVSVEVENDKPWLESKLNM